ncbi:MAG: aspartate aminotransferase family protein [Chloroflexota bacterium]
MSTPLTRTTTRAEEYFEAAKRVLPGGVSASARLHKSLGRPMVAQRGAGGLVYDIDGREYVDLCTGFGAGLMGHGHPAIKTAINDIVERGILCSWEVPEVLSVAQKLTEIIPCAEFVRFATSGTETTWHAVRTARVFTGRPLVVKFEGHFHGYNDHLGYTYWPPVEQLGALDAMASIPASEGMPGSLAESVLVLPFNEPSILERVLRARGSDIAAVILEPINFNSGGVLPAPGFLELLRRLTAELGIILIFDEILSGFRTGPGCAQEYLGVTPDMCTLGKSLGGGTALSAFMGRRDVMSAVAPLGGAVHSGTFNAHPIAMAAANAFLDEIKRDGFWPRLDAIAQRLYPGLRQAFASAGLPVWVQGVGNRFCLVFGLAEEPTSYRQSGLDDKDLQTRFFAAAIEEGVYFHNMYHHGFSIQHTDEQIDRAIEAVGRAARRVMAGR